MKLLDLLFPPRCPFCDSLQTRMGICEDCKSQLVFVEDPFCMKCGKQLQDQETEYCGDCMKKQHIYESGRSLFLYTDIVRHSIYRYKYGKRKEYAKIYAALLYRQLGDFIRQTQPDYFVPVPLHRKRLRKRGYNQALLIAKALAKESGIACRGDLVKRVKNTKPQKELNAAMRQNNLKKAFKIMGNDVKLKTIILIDDIYTTGSTMDALADVFLTAGAAKIYFVTLASGNNAINGGQS